MVSITRRVLGSFFVGYLPLTSQNPYPIKIHFVAITDPIFKSLLAKCDFHNPTMSVSVYTSAL